MSRHYQSNDGPRAVWDPPPATPYARDSDPSMEAAVLAEPRAGTQMELVLTFLRQRHAWDGGGATDEEIQDFLSMNPSTQRPHRGLVVDSGRTRLTRSGRKATVWVAT